MRYYDEENDSGSEIEDYEEKDSEEEIEDGDGDGDFVASFEQKMQSSVIDDCGGLPDFIKNRRGGRDMKKLIAEVNRFSKTPEERFKQIVGAIAYTISDDNIIKISTDERNKMCRKANDLLNTKYLNPTAYVLGYIASEGGIGINNKLINMTFNSLSKIKDSSVTNPDIIRYARFWVNIGPE